MSPVYPYSTQDIDQNYACIHLILHSSFRAIPLQFGGGGGDNAWTHQDFGSPKASRFRVPQSNEISFSEKGQEKVKVKTTGIVCDFIIPANCWNHDWRSKSNGSMSLIWGPQKSVSDTRTDGRYYQVPTGVRRGTIMAKLTRDTTQYVTMQSQRTTSYKVRYPGYIRW